MLSCCMFGFFGPPAVTISSSESGSESELRLPSLELEMLLSESSSSVRDCTELMLLWRLCSEAGGLLCRAESSETEQEDGSLLLL